MKHRAVLAIGLPCLLLTGCIQSEQVFTLNPDGSGKVAITLVTPLNPFEGVLGGGGPPGGKKLSLADKKRMFVDKLLRDAKGVDAWKDVSAEFTREGLLKFQGIAYFKDMQQLKIEPVGGSPARLERRPDGSLRLAVVPDKLGAELNKFGAKEEPADLKNLSDQELDEYILTKRVEYQGAKGIVTALLTDLKFKAVFRLPGEVSDVKGYQAEGKGTLSLTLDGNKILKALNELMLRDTASIRKELRAGGSFFSGDPKKIFKVVGREWLDASAVVQRPGGPQFDYAKEAAAAREAYPALRKRLGLVGEEQKSPELRP
jgi:hypothetical protein